MKKNKGLARISIDVPIEDYMYIKLASAKLGISVQQFATSAINKALYDYEMDLDVAAYDEAMARFEANGCKTMTLEEFTKKLGWEDNESAATS